jgi:hypothetical protein
MGYVLDVEWARDFAVSCGSWRCVDFLHVPFNSRAPESATTNGTDNIIFRLTPLPGFPLLWFGTRIAKNAACLFIDRLHIKHA